MIYDPQKYCSGNMSIVQEIFVPWKIKINIFDQLPPFLSMQNLQQSAVVRFRGTSNHVLF